MLSDQFCVGVWKPSDPEMIRHLFLSQVPIYKLGINISTDCRSRMSSLDLVWAMFYMETQVTYIDLGDKIKLGLQKDIRREELFLTKAFSFLFY